MQLLHVLFAIYIFLLLHFIPFCTYCIDFKMVVSFNTFNIIIFCCKDTSFIFVTRWLHVVADLSLSNRLFKIYTLTHLLYLFLISYIFWWRGGGISNSIQKPKICHLILPYYWYGKRNFFNCLFFQ